ncbi:hypothetical protein B1987_12445, partial [Mycobacterium kansasii]
MSLLIAAPESLVAAATDFAAIGATVSAATTAAAAPTTTLLAAAQDEVSAAIATMFSAHAVDYQALSRQAAVFHQQFVGALTAGAAAYAGAEAANVVPLQQILDAINAPARTLTGRPLIGNGTNGTPGTGQDGAPGGWLLGDGGSGGSGAPGASGGNGGTAGLLGAGG